MTGALPNNSNMSNTAFWGCVFKKKGNIIIIIIITIIIIIIIIICDWTW